MSERDKLHLTRRGVLVGVGVTGVGALLAACGQAPAAAPEAAKEEMTEEAKPKAEEPAPEKEPVHIRYGTWLNARQLENYPQTLVEPFQDAHPGVTVEVIHNMHAYQESFRTAFAAGEQPDAAWEADNATYLLGYFVDLADYIKRDNFDLSHYPQNIFNSISRIRNEINSLPNQTGGNMMALPYNREILEKAGLNEPSATWGDPEWNWDAYIDMAKKTTVTEGGTVATVGASNMGTGALVGNLPFLWGGQWVSDDRRSAVCDSPETIDCYRSYFSMVHEHGAMLKPGQGADLFGESSIVKLFYQGKLAFLNTLSSGTFGDMMQRIRDEDLPIDFAPLPTVKNVASFQWTDANGVVTNAKHPEEAWQYVAWQGSTLNWAVGKGTIPPRADLMETWANETFPDLKDKVRLSVIIDVLDYPGGYDPGWVVPNFAFSGSAEVKDWVNAVYAGTAGVDEGLLALKPQIQAILDDTEEKYKG